MGHVAASEGFSPTFFVDGAGADIWGTADAFRFVYQFFSDDGEIVARVVAQDSTHPFAKAGVMLRSSLDPSSPHVILDVKPDGGLELMARSASGHDTVFIGGGQAAPMAWLKLVRSGSEVTGLHSGDGLNWTTIGAIALTSMPSDLVAGLAVTSHEPTRVNHAIFDSVRVSSPTHNLLMFESFEEYGSELGPRPELGPIGWISDHAFRQIPGKGRNEPAAFRHTKRRLLDARIPGLRPVSGCDRPRDRLVHAATLCQRGSSGRSRGRQRQRDARRLS